jgi:mannose-6-phosphate isomerase-like protein (cupin superfamily)
VEAEPSDRAAAQPRVTGPSASPTIALRARARTTEEDEPPVTSSDDAPTPTADEAPDRAPSVRPVDLRDYVDFSRGEATRVRVFASDHLALDLWCVEPQQATPVLHLPDRDVTYTVVGGRSWFVTDDGEVGLDPLGAMLVPAGVVHGIDNRAPDPLIVVAVSSPPSDEAETTPVSEEAAAVRYDPGPGALRRLLDKLFGDRR